MALTSPFYVNLPSNTVHPSRENKVSSFYVKLPTTLLLQGAWEVALVEVNIPVSWYNFPETPEKNRTIIAERIDFKLKTEEEKITSLDEVEIQKRYVVQMIPYGNYTSLDSLIRCVNLALKKIDVYSDDELYRNSREPYMKTELQNLKPILKVGRGDRVTMSKYLSRILRLDTANEAEINDNKVVSFTGLPLRTLIDFQILMSTKERYKHYKYFKAGGVPNLHHVSSNIYIYTDIVSNEAVGDVQMPLLRTIRCSDKFGDDIKEVFVNPYYKRLRRNEIQEIHIKICDDLGELVKFEYGTVFIVLHFRPLKPRFID